MYKYAGYTLVELLIAAMLGTLLSASLFSSLYASLQANQLRAATQSVQENAALAIHFLRQDFNLFDFTGCFDGTLKDIDITSTGVVADQIAQFGALRMNPLASKSDSISLVSVSSAGADLIGSMATPHSSLDLPAEHQVLSGQEVLVTDCESAELVTITDVWQGRLSHQMSGNKNANLRRAYPQGSSVYPLTLVSYKLAKGVNGRTGLYRKLGKAYFQELVPNVVALDIRYGLVNSKTALTEYLSSSEVLQTQQVISIEIQMLLSSNEPVMTANMLLKNRKGESYIAADKRFYKWYTVSIALRNRG